VKKRNPKLLLRKQARNMVWEEEIFEDFKDVYMPTDYPEPTRKFRVVYESFSIIHGRNILLDTWSIAV